MIDDDESVRSSTEGLLRSFGYSVRVFGSAEEFLASGAVERCACVVSDIQMPGLSGLDLTDLLAIRNPALPVILITAYRDERTIQRGNKAGAVCILPKPFSAETLVDCIAKAISV